MLYDIFIFFTVYSLAYSGCHGTYQGNSSSYGNAPSYADAEIYKTINMWESDDFNMKPFRDVYYLFLTYNEPCIFVTNKYKANPDQECKENQFLHVDRVEAEIRGAHLYNALFIHASLDSALFVSVVHGIIWKRAYKLPNAMFGLEPALQAKVLEHVYLSELCIPCDAITSTFPLAKQLQNVCLKGMTTFAKVVEPWRKY